MVFLWIASLLVLDPPGPPGKPEGTDWNRDFIDLKWAAPDKDGGSPITGYIIEKREQGTTRFFKCLEIKGTFYPKLRWEKNAPIYIIFT